MALSNAAKDIVIKIRADDSQYQAALKKADSTTASFASNMSGYGKTMAVALSSAAVAATAFSVNAAANYEGVERAFGNLVKSQGKDADEYVKKLKEATSGTASQAALIAQANDAMLLGLDIDTLVQMAEGATAIAQATGKSSDYLFQSMALGTARQSRLVLDNLGIIVDTEKAYSDYATTLGKTTSELTEQEKKTAFLGAAMVGLNERVDALGGFSKDTKSEIDKLKSSLSDMSVDIGEKFLPAVNDVVGAVNDWGDAGGWDKIAQGADKAAYKTSLYGAALGELAGVAGTAWDKVSPLTEGIDFQQTLMDALAPGTSLGMDIRGQIDEYLAQRYPELNKSTLDWNPFEHPINEGMNGMVEAVNKNTEAVNENTESVKQSIEENYNQAALSRGDYGVYVEGKQRVEADYNYRSGSTLFKSNQSGV